MKHYNLCLLGFGNVGRALAQLLQAKTIELREQYGIEWHITGVATRRMGWLAQPNGFEVSELLSGTSPTVSTVAHDVHTWLQAAQADVLFELSSLNPTTGQPAIDHLRAALEHGAHAITANKGPIVYGYQELRDLAARQGKRFLFEATVAGGVPIFSLFRETRPLVKLLRFHGIFNATTTVIIEGMERGLSFEAAVRTAQDMGIAETDPSADVDGWDAAVKVCALANVLMDMPLHPDQIQREGIGKLDGAAIQAARAAGRVYRLVSRGELVDGRVIASVRPEQLSMSDPLAGVESSTLLGHFETDLLPGLTVALHNGSAHTTAYDVFADFISAARVGSP